MDKNTNTNTNTLQGTMVAIAPKPSYDQVPVIGATVKTITGTKARATIKGRLLLTEQAGFGIGEGLSEAIVAESGEKDRIIWSVSKVEKAKLWVRIATGAKSFADGFEFRGGYTSKDKDNAECRVLFVDAADCAANDTIAKMLDCADAMCDQDAAACGYWEFVDADNVRTFIRLYEKVGSNGKIADAE